jgi:hypothetical protein
LIKRTRFKLEGANDALPRHRLQPPSSSSTNNNKNAIDEAHGFKTQKHQNNTKINNQIHYFARFFTLIMNMPIVFNESSWKGKNEASKVFKPKHKITIQYKLEQMSKPESIYT